MSKKNKKNDSQTNTPKHFELRKVTPLTVNQTAAFTTYNTGKHMLLHGIAGTGKTFISIYLALQTILNSNQYKKLKIIRSVVPSRDIGFLPGSAKEKAAVYETAYKDMVDDLFGRGDGYETLKRNGLLDFTTTSFLRGSTFDDSIILVDEIQNMTFAELDTIITRVGNNCRIIFCGDYRQTDFTRNDEKSGLLTFMRILDTIDSFEKIEFGVEDIVRSAMVKQYIIAKLKIGMV